MKLLMSETISPSRPVALRCSMLHGNPFPDNAPQDFKEKRLVLWISEETKTRLAPVAQRHLKFMEEQNVSL